jgi:hypothetical protein
MSLAELLVRIESHQQADIELAKLFDANVNARIANTAARFGERPGEYVAGAARRFANLAQDAEWTGVIAAAESAPDPANAVLSRMIRWALKQDAEPARMCGCGRHHGDP